jgi:hypothetical protein
MDAVILMNRDEKIRNTLLQDQLPPAGEELIM